MLSNFAVSFRKVALSARSQISLRLGNGGNRRFLFSEWVGLSFKICLFIERFPASSPGAQLGQIAAWAFLIESKKNTVFHPSRTAVPFWGQNYLEFE